MYMYARAYMWSSIGQLVEVSYLLLPGGFWVSNSVIRLEYKHTYPLSHLSGPCSGCSPLLN